MQFNYSYDMAYAFPGMLAEYGGANDIVTGYVEQEEGIPYAVGVVQGTRDNGILLPFTNKGLFKGIMVHEHREPAPRVKRGDVTPVLRKGRIYVLSEQDVTPRDNVYLRFSAVNGGVVGMFRKDSASDGSRAHAMHIDRVEWVTSAIAGQPVVLEVNLP